MTSRRRKIVIYKRGQMVLKCVHEARVKVLKGTGEHLSALLITDIPLPQTVFKSMCISMLEKNNNTC